MGLQVLEPAEFERARMRRLQHHRRRAPGKERLLPTSGAKAPLIARLNARKLKLRYRGAQIVPLRPRVRQELPRRPDANRVRADIVRTRPTAPVPKEPSHRVLRARLQLPTQDILFDENVRI